MSFDFNPLVHKKEEKHEELQQLQIELYYPENIPQKEQEEETKIIVIEL